MECGACSKNCPADALSVQSGVGCAAAVINSMLGKNNAACSCGSEPAGTINDKRGGCCCG